MQDDLLDSENRYRLMDTGQGLNRVQSCPRVGRAMHNILAQCQRELGGWVGSSVIHLGDRNVRCPVEFFCFVLFCFVLFCLFVCLL
jgi:hypothetical protein